jgi:H+-transporting ATPase
MDKNQTSNDFTALTIDETLSRLQSNSATGLTQTEAKQRIERYGPNAVEEKQQNPVIAFLKSFWGLTAWMLEIAIVISFVLGNFLDLYIITVLLVVNALLGFFQEQQATRAVKALKQKLQVQARVLRAGLWSTISAVELVPGDIIRIRSGDLVPSDLKIMDSEITVDQSAITGESMPLEKKKSDLVFSGSMIRKGEATGVVTSTGTHTYFGKTTILVQLAKPKLHMETVISGLMKWLLILASCFAYNCLCSVLDTRFKPASYAILGINFIGVSNTCGSAYNVHRYNGTWITRTCKERSLSYTPKRIRRCCSHGCSVCR